MSRPRPATLHDIDEAALALPEVTRDPETGGRPSYAVHGRTFAFARGPRKDAYDPRTGEPYDDVLVFRPLSRAHLARIVDLQLSRVRALLPSGVTLDVEDTAKARLVELGYQPALGARPLRRAILKNVQDPLAEKLLDRSLSAGGALTLKLSGDDLVLEASPAR